MGSGLVRLAAICFILGPAGPRNQRRPWAYRLCNSNDTTHAVTVGLSFIAAETTVATPRKLASSLSGRLPCSWVTAVRSPAFGARLRRTLALGAGLHRGTNDLIVTQIMDQGADTMRADYIIVGAGSAGCVLANRLTEDPSTNVILHRGGWPRPQPADPRARRLLQDARPPHLDLEIPLRAGSRHQWTRHRLHAWQGDRWFLLDQRTSLHPRPTRGLRTLGTTRQSRLDVGRLPAVLPRRRTMGRRGQRRPWQGRTLVHLENGPLPDLRDGH